MKKLSVILVLIIILGVLASCDGIGNDAPETVRVEQTYEFSYEIAKREYLRGEEFEITAIVKNVSGKTQRYMGCSAYDFFPHIELYLPGSSELEVDSPLFPADVVEKKVKKNEVGSNVCKVRVPDGAEIGSYSLRLFFGGDTCVFTDVLSIVASTAQNSSEKYEYSSVTVISGDGEINPIRAYLGSTHYSEGRIEQGCGGGAWLVFDDPESDHADFPTLVLEGGITVLPPVNVYIGNIRIYDTEYNELKYKFDSLGDLSELPEGEYIVVYYAEADGRGCEPDITEYTITEYEDIFKLIVLKNNTELSAFSYADVLKTYKENDPGVISGGFNNTSVSEIKNRDDAVERAKNECTIGYDSVSVAYDSRESVWEIVFYTQGVLGGCQSVYMNKDGVTLLIVYGE